MASEIQKTFLPGDFPALEGVRGAVASVPALEVGGDFYDVIRLPRGRVGVMVGDVSGKGVPGALFGARLMRDVRYQALFHDDVALTLTSVNRIVCRARHARHVRDLPLRRGGSCNGEVVYGNAGHLAPIVRHADGRLTRWEDPGGCPLGILPDIASRPTRRLAKGEVLLILSDGIGDAVGEGGERFGDERVEATIARGPGDPAPS